MLGLTVFQGQMDDALGSTRTKKRRLATAD
jgi:hypothetical protein